MDPTQTIVDVLADPSKRQDARQALADWYACRGYRPSLFDVQSRAAAEGVTLSRYWKATARRLGAV